MLPNCLTRCSGTASVDKFSLCKLFIHSCVITNLYFRQGLTGIQWLASEAWSTAAVLSTPKKYHPILQGTIGFAIRGAHIPGLQDFLLRLNPLRPDVSKDPFVVPFWEEVFQCEMATSADGQGDNVDGKPQCTGAERLRSVHNIYSDVSQLRISYNVYKAVYVVARALQAMRSCVKGGPFPMQACPDINNIKPWQVPYHTFNNYNAKHSCFFAWRGRRHHRFIHNIVTFLPLRSCITT